MNFRPRCPCKPEQSVESMGQWIDRLQRIEDTHDMGNMGAPILAMINLFSGAMFALSLFAFALIDSFVQ